jgi:hypothetical protein
MQQSGRADASDSSGLQVREQLPRQRMLRQIGGATMPRPGPLQGDLRERGRDRGSLLGKNADIQSTYLRHYPLPLQNREGVITSNGALKPLPNMVSL